MHQMKISRLLLMAAIHFPIMYLVMFSMIDSMDQFHHNLNMVYMAGMMTAPMLLIEIMLMGKMYENKKAIIGVGVGSLLAFILFFVFTRQQTAIGDTEFLRSMIPHHSGAILMCREATLTDPELQRLCESIDSTQRQEIEQMEKIRVRLNP